MQTRWTMPVHYDFIVTCGQNARNDAILRRHFQGNWIATMASLGGDTSGGVNGLMWDVCGAYMGVVGLAGTLPDHAADMPSCWTFLGVAAVTLGTCA